MGVSIAPSCRFIVCVLDSAIWRLLGLVFSVLEAILVSAPSHPAWNALIRLARLVAASAIKTNGTAKESSKHPIMNRIQAGL